jgi:glucose-6-phosphate 1-dehydrogenase
MVVLSILSSAWAVVEPVLKSHYRAILYKRGSWGPKEADALFATDGGWHKPLPKQST